MELTNAKTEEELYQKILDDMLNYNEKAAGHYDDYIGIFEDFLDDYKTNLEKLQELKELEREYMTPDYYINKNDNNFSDIYEEAIGNSSTKKTLDLSIDYSAEMEKAIAAGDLAQAKYLQTLRDQKADILDITLGKGNYRSNSKVISDAMEKFGMTSGGTVKNANTTTLDKSVDYALEIQKAIARGDYDSVKAYADLRTEKAGDKLGTGVYKSNKDIIREALDYYGVRYTEDISDGIGYLANNGDAVKLLVQTGVVANEKLAKEYITASSLSYGKLTDSYNVQKDSNGTIIGMSAKADVTNAGITNTNDKLTGLGAKADLTNNGIANSNDKLGLLNTGVDGINGGINATNESLNGLGNSLGDVDKSVHNNTDCIIEQIKKTGGDIVSAQGMSREEIEQALSDGKYVNFGEFTTWDGQTGHIVADPNKKAPVINTVDEDPGVIGSQAWLSQVRNDGEYSWSDDDIIETYAKITAENIERQTAHDIYNMKRNPEYAGKTITTGPYTVEYDERGYAISKTHNKSTVSDQGTRVYSGKEAISYKDFAKADTIKQNIELVAKTANEAGYRIDSVGGVIASQIAASSKEEITQAQANALIQQMNSAGILKDTASLVNSSDEISKLMSTMEGSIDKATEYLKNIDASQKEALNNNYKYTGSSPSYVGGVAGGTYASGSTENDHSGRYINGKYYSGKSAQGGANTDYDREDRSTSDNGKYDKYTDYSAAYEKATSDAERREIIDARNEKIDKEYGGVDPNPEWGKTHTYSSGLENGPVTYTGLAMLHGTPSAPEYVLNNDQAYNLLYNMSSARMAEFESTSKSDGGVQYIVQGDIILEGIDDPSQFWQEVTTAMGNRWNVTKNK